MAERVCEEQQSCGGMENKAAIFCLECGTYQCSKCEYTLHSTRETKLHSRERLTAQGGGGRGKPCELWCEPRNPLAVRCGECGLETCKECDTRMHQGKRRSHVRQQITPMALAKRDGSTGDRGTDTPGRTPSLSSLLLVNDKEEIMVSDPGEFIGHLGCSARVKVKVVSIFGNTGDGKSHTLNHTFFNGREVFRTSTHQSSCTIGIWAAYSPDYGAIFIDTEGMLGTSSNENQRTRLLLKVLAVSDIVIYRTQAERLHNDLFTFLGDASEAYWKYFTPELKAASERFKLNVPLSMLGPSVIVFHETQHTEILGEGATPEHVREKASVMDAGAAMGTMLMREASNRRSSEGWCDVVDDTSPVESTTQEQGPTVKHDTMKSEACGEDVSAEQRPGTATAAPMTAEELLKIRFAELGCIPRAFCSVEYVGTRTSLPPTDFSGLRSSVAELLRNNAVRAPRRPEVVLKALQVLNEKFIGDIDSARPTTFPDAYFTCPQLCLACGARCDLSMNHGKDGVRHRVRGVRCRYSHQYDNKIHLCKECFNQGTESVVVPKTYSTGESSWIGIAKYAWSGYVIECKNCGVIYRSRKHWYGNKEPEQSAIKTENKHVWPEDLLTAGQGSDNTARRILDGMGSVAGAVGSVSIRPTKMVCGWVTDQIAPSYWTPNSKILECGECKREFQLQDTKHHCRACGGGFCNKCSSRSMPVPERGWGNIPVRVCNGCYKKRSERGKGRDGYRTDTSTVGAEARPQNLTEASGQGEKVTARYVGEMMQSAVGAVTGVMGYPRGVIVESARPVYWVPDADITCCHQCKREFSPEDTKHHCRACGQGFCEGCSGQQKAVPTRGWDYPVRVCVSCAGRQDL